MNTLLCSIADFNHCNGYMCLFVDSRDEHASRITRWHLEETSFRVVVVCSVQNGEQLCISPDGVDTTYLVSHGWNNGDKINTRIIWDCWRLFDQLNAPFQMFLVLSLTFKCDIGLYVIKIYLFKLIKLKFFWFHLLGTSITKSL